MTRIVADRALQVTFNGCREQVEVCDEAGNTLGHFLPSEEYNKFFYSRLASECPYSGEELQRMHQEAGGRTLTEIWKDLGVS